MLLWATGHALNVLHGLSWQTYHCSEGRKLIASCEATGHVQPMIWMCSRWKFHAFRMPQRWRKNVRYFSNSLRPWVCLRFDAVAVPCHRHLRWYYAWSCRVCDLQWPVTSTFLWFNSERLPAVQIWFSVSHLGSSLCRSASSDGIPTWIGSPVFGWYHYMWSSIWTWNHMFLRRMSGALRPMGTSHLLSGIFLPWSHWCPINFHFDMCAVESTTLADSICLWHAGPQR